MNSKHNAGIASGKNTRKESKRNGKTKFHCISS